MPDIEDVDSFLLRNESWAKLMAWGFFTLFLAGSFIVIDIVILYVWISAFLMFSGVIYYMESKDDSREH